MKTIGFIFGTRPEVIKCIPIILEAKERGLQTKVIFTGQHKEMALPILDFFDIKIDIDLDIMVKNQTLVQLSSNLLTALSDNLSELERCDIVLVQGDTTSAFIGGYFCFLNKISVGHIEAGLRTNNLDSPFPEEGNRQLLSRISNYHFTPTEIAAKELLSENIPEHNIYNVGNTVIDTLLAVREKISPNVRTEIFKKFNIDKKEYVLITGHRRENIGNGFMEICDALKNISTKYNDLNFIYPVHLNPKVKDVVEKELSGQENIKLIPPQGYVEFVSLMSGARIIMTDSGGVQEEAPSFNIPIVVMRDTTERPEGVKLGIAKLCGTNPVRLLEAFDYYYEKGYDSDILNPYGDGQASEKIINILTNI